MFVFRGIGELITRAIGFISAGVRQALTPEEIIEAIAPVTGEVEEELFVPFIRDLEEQYETWGRIPGIPREYRIPESFSFPTLTHQARKYRYNIFVTVESGATGEVYDRWYTIESDNLLTRGEVEEDALNRIPLLPGSQDERVIDFQDWEFLRRLDEEDWV
jgi:hypothetical protein